MRLLLSIAFTIGLSYSAPFAVFAQQADPTIDWGARLKGDSQAIHDILFENHPGTYDEQNPAFRQTLEDGLTLAQQRAAKAKDVAGWWWAMRGYVASFDDGHMQLNAKIALDFPKQWAGVLTRYDNGRHVVGISVNPKTLPPVGSELLGCDGVSVEALAQTRIGAFRGRWFLTSQKVAFGDYLLVDLGNPYLTNPKTCTFKVGKKTKKYTLTYGPISSDALQAERDKMKPRRAYEFGQRDIEGGIWISMPGFDGEPDSYDFKALKPIMTDLAARQDTVRQSKIIVLDVRGNGGGSSSWSRDIANIIWGEAWVKLNQPDGSASVDWRVSKGNIQVIDDYYKDFSANGGSPEVISWLENASKNMHAAMDAGQPYWNEFEPPADKSALASAQSMTTAKVYVLTDYSCASACLDAVDLWKALGAIQVGTETSADTFYMEIRPEALPSGAAEIAFPMKVYRGRARGNNETQKPHHAFDGDMTNDDAILAWIMTLK